MDRRAFLGGVAAGGIGMAMGDAALAQISNPAAQVAAQLRDRALSDTTAWDLVSSLTTEVGQRLAGTEAAARAKDWGLAKLRALGFANVHAEPFPIRAWIRGPESAAVVAPYVQSLAILGLGGSVGTPAQGIEAPITVFSAYEELLAAAPGSLNGRIAVVNQLMPRNQDGSGYGYLNPARRAGPSEASRRGAIGYLVRSLSSDPTSRLPHAGSMGAYQPGVTPIQAAALSVTDADQLARMAAIGPVRVRFSMQPRTVENAPAWNVSGEITGTQSPEEYIVIGGHLDSWDPGTGAIDDGAGVAITTAAAHLIGQLPRHPKRTIRVVMWGAEEMDFSADAYAAAHANEAGRIVLAGECDSGADRIWSVALPPNALRAPTMAGLATVLAPLQVVINPQVPQGAGSDTRGIIRAGAAAVSLRQDATRYFDWHHSADDTLDKIDRAQLNQNVAAWTSVIYMLAESGVDFRATATPVGASS